MNRIIACTPSWYHEEPVATLLPNPDGRFPDGLHTFSVGPNSILVDGKRSILDWNILLQRLWKRVRKTRTARLTCPQRGRRLAFASHQRPAACLQVQDTGAPLLLLTSNRKLLWPS